MKIRKLVVDSNAFFSRISLWEFGEELYTLPTVLDEIRDNKTKQFINSLPFELNLRTPNLESIKFIADFTKKTGDYPSLSLVDIQILALTFELEKLAKDGSTSHLRMIPNVSRPEVFACKPTTSNNFSTLPEGFYVPNQKPAGKDKREGDVETQELPTEKKGNFRKDEIKTVEIESRIVNTLASGITDIVVGDQPAKESSLGNASEENEERKEGEVGDSFKITTNKRFPEQSFYNQNVPYSLRDSSEIDVSHYGDNFDPVFQENLSEDPCDHYEGFYEPYDSNSERDDENQSSDEDGWITPKNLKSMKQKVKRQMDADTKDTDVACMTTDFAMQNTLKHIGLSVVGYNGLLIKGTKTFTLRCHACFKLTNKMDRIFCPHCGHKTLKRVSVTIEEDGSRKIWLSNKPLNIRGTKFSLPTPQGGKHAANPVLVADQRVPRDKPSKKVLQREMNPLNPDFITGSRPFAVRDVYSRSSQLGITAERKHRGTYYWEQKNPNESRKNTRRKR